MLCLKKIIVMCYVSLKQQPPVPFSEIVLHFLPVVHAHYVWIKRSYGYNISLTPIRKVLSCLSSLQKNNWGWFSSPGEKKALQEMNNGIIGTQEDHSSMATVRSGTLLSKNSWTAWQKRSKSIDATDLLRFSKCKGFYGMSFQSF